MNGFISHIIQRRLQTENTVQPRLPGRFESFHAAQNPDGTDMVESEGFNTSPNQKINNSANNVIEKPNSKNQNSPVDFGNLSDEIKHDKNDLFPKPEFQTIDLDKAEAASHNDQIVRGTLITNINPGIFVRENSDHTTHNENLFNKSLRPESPSPLVFQKNRHSSPNQNDVFFENHKQTPPTIKVSIGRIEVRAITSPQAVKKEANTTQRPDMSLDDYLKKRNDNK